MRILNLLIKLRREDKCDMFVVPYAVNADIKDPEARLRTAIQDFMTSGTEAAMRALEYSCGDFNWGDVASFVPDSYFINVGLTPIDENSIDVIVDHDEVCWKEQVDEN